MKFKLYNELLNESNIMSHVFLNCANECITEIADKNSTLTEEEIENREIEIELKIDGKECDPRKFFSLLWEQYSFLVEKEAKNIIKSQTSEKLVDIQSKIQDLEQVLECWANEINWSVPNKFLR